MRKEVFITVLFFNLIFSLAIVSAVPYDFGGMYYKNILNDACIRTNPATTACSCPTGYNLKQTWGFDTLDNDYPNDNKVFYCYRNHTEGVNGYYDFGGMYYAYLTNNACIRTNPVTKACSCPTGYTQQQLTGADWPNTDGNSYYCYKPYTGTSGLEFGGLIGTYYWAAPYTYAHVETKTLNCPEDYNKATILGYPNFDWTLYLCYKNITQPPTPPTPTETHFCPDSSQVIMKLFSPTNSHAELFTSSTCIGTPNSCNQLSQENCPIAPTPPNPIPANYQISGCYWDADALNTLTSNPFDVGICKGTPLSCSLSEDNRDLCLSKGCDWNGSNYNYEICYDEIFGSSYTGANPHSCTGTNKVLGLYSTTNSHAEIPSENTYTQDVCYGNLECHAITGSPEPRNCPTGYNLVVSLYEGTNAHVAAGNFVGYPVKICCKPQAPIAAGDVYWANMNQAPLIAPNNKAQINDSVLLIWNNSGLSDGTQVTFSIKEKDMLLNDKIRDVIGIVKSGKATAKWKITNADYSLGKDLIGSSEFIFQVQGKTSGELIIEETISNTRPTIEIISPIDESIHLKGAQINFNQISSDPDDELVVTWGFGDSLSERKTGNCQFPGNCNTNHTYNLAGTKIVSATASETDRGQSATDRIRIAIYEDGLNLIPIISSPDPRTITAFSGRNVFFNGSESYIANCTAHRNNCNLALAPSGKPELTQANCYDVTGIVNNQQVTLHCFDYPKSWIVNSPRGYELWFNWTFMQANQYYGNVLGNWGSNYNEAVEFNKFFVGNSNLLREVNLRIGFDYHN